VPPQAAEQANLSGVIDVVERDTVKLFHEFAPRGVGGTSQPKSLRLRLHAVDDCEKAAVEKLAVERLRVLGMRAPDSHAGSMKMGVEPGNGAADAVALVVGLHEVVAFVFVDDELGFDS
jgi:hypothetical protein